MLDDREKIGWHSHAESVELFRALAASGRASYGLMMGVQLMRNEATGVMVTIRAKVNMKIVMAFMALMLGWGCVSAADSRSAKVPAILAEALAVLRVNDPRMLDRETTQFAAGLGINPEPLRAALAHVLFRSRNLDGIDLSRPALMAWRAGSPPLLAVIPLSDRRLFLENFGAGFGEDAPLIRVGERDGTVVYTQNGNEGLIEYRLLVSDRAAYLAGSIAACRELADFPLQAAAKDSPLIFTANAAFIAQMNTVTEASPAFGKMSQTVVPGLGNLHHLVRPSWNAFTSQLSKIEFSLRPDQQGNMNFAMRMDALPDSALSVWVANQRNQPSRLSSIVRSEHSVFTLAGNIMWQGQAERFGGNFEPTLKQLFGDRWTSTVDENWTSLWTLFDRAGPFAMAADVTIKDGKPVSETRYLVDQPKAQELMSLINLVTQDLTGAASEAVTAGNATGFHETRPDGDTALVSNDRFLVSVQSTMRSAVVAAADVVNRSQTNGALEGNPAVLHLSANLTPLVRTLVVAMGGELQPALPNATCGLIFKVGLPGSLEAEGTFPAAAVARLMRDSGLMQFLAPAGPGKSGARGLN